MTNTTPERVNILTEASNLITGQRQQDYGTPEENFQRMADFANILFAKNLKENIPLSPRQMADFMILLKVARTINTPTRDSYVDIGGYAGIAGELAKIDSERKDTFNVATTFDLDDDTSKKEASNQTGGSWNDPSNILPENFRKVNGAIDGKTISRDGAKG